MADLKQGPQEEAPAQVQMPLRLCGLGCYYLANGMVCDSREKLAEYSVENLGLPRLSMLSVVHNMRYTGLKRCGGGQATVHICEWASPPGDPRPGIIPEGQRVAIKHITCPQGGARPYVIDTEEEFERAQEAGERGLRIELNILDVLAKGGCGDRVIKPLAWVGWRGEWMPDANDRKTRYFEPIFGYVMPAYPRGSVTTLLSDICHRRVPEAAAHRYVGLPTLSGEYQVLLQQLHKMHTTPGVQLMLQDLTPNNLLVDDTGADGSVRLLFCDPAVALPIPVLDHHPPPRGSVLGTWVWGSMRARRGWFDPKADLYSLSFVFTEMWLVAEGAAVPLLELTRYVRLMEDRTRAVQFARNLVVQTLRQQLHGGEVVPRIKRHMPVSWLGAWMLLLGFRDYAMDDQMGLPCLRPTEKQMLGLAGQWASIVAAAEALPVDLSDEEAQSAACDPLVQGMCAMLGSLLQLSRLSNTQQQDANLAWLAAHFMALKHPLVEAMRQQGGAGMGQPERKRPSYGWQDVVQNALWACGHAAKVRRMEAVHMEGHQQQVDAAGDRRALGKLYQWHCAVAGTLPAEQQPPQALVSRMKQAARDIGLLEDSAPSAAAQPSQAPPAPAAAHDSAVTTASVSPERRGMDGQAGLAVPQCVPPGLQAEERGALQCEPQLCAAAAGGGGLEEGMCSRGAAVSRGAGDNTPGMDTLRRLSSFEEVLAAGGYWVGSPELAWAWDEAAGPAGDVPQAPAALGLAAHDSVAAGSWEGVRPMEGVQQDLQTSPPGWDSLQQGNASYLAAATSPHKGCRELPAPATDLAAGDDRPLGSPAASEEDAGERQPKRRRLAPPSSAAQSPSASAQQSAEASASQVRVERDGSSGPGVAGLSGDSWAGHMLWRVGGQPGGAAGAAGAAAAAKGRQLEGPGGTKAQALR